MKPILQMFCAILNIFNVCHMIDSIYTERYMGSPVDNRIGYDVCYKIFFVLSPIIFQQTIPQNGLRAEKFGPLYLCVHSMPFNIFIFMFYIRLSFFCNTVLFRTEARQQHSWWLVSFDPWHRRRLVELMGKIFIMWKTEINEGFECQA